MSTAGDLSHAWVSGGQAPGGHWKLPGVKEFPKWSLANLWLCRDPVFPGDGLTEGVSWVFPAGKVEAGSPLAVIQLHLLWLITGGFFRASPTPGLSNVLFGGLSLPLWRWQRRISFLFYGWKRVT